MLSKSSAADVLYVGLKKKQLPFVYCRHIQIREDALVCYTCGNIEQNRKLILTYTKYIVIDKHKYIYKISLK